MNGTSLVLLKSCCPMYNFGSSNKNYLIPCRLPNLQRLRVSSPFEATKPLFKHRVHSSSAKKDGTWGFQVPEATRAAAPYVLLGVGITCVALVTALGAVVKFVFTNGWKEGVLEPKVYYYIIIGVAAACAAGSLFANLMSGFAVQSTKLFSVGDLIEVGPVSGRVFEMGLITSSILLTAENRVADVPTSWLNGQDVVNKSRAPPLHRVLAKFHVKPDKFDKIPEISEEIRNLMRSKPFIYLGEEQLQPYCYLSGLGPFGVTLSIGCLVEVVVGEEEKLPSVKSDIFNQSIQIIKKHGATLGSIS